MTAPAAALSFDGTPAVEGLATLQRLQDAGWQVGDATGGMWIEARAEGEDPTSALHALTSLGPALTAFRARGRRRGFDVVIGLVRGELEVLETPSVDPDSDFDEPEERDHARRVVDREVDAALALPLDWTVTAEIRLDLLMTCPSSIDCRVVQRPETVTSSIELLGPALGGFVGQDGKRRVYLVADAVGALHLGTLSVCPLRQQIEVPPPLQPLPAESGAPFAGAVWPHQLVPQMLGSEGEWIDTAIMLYRVFVLAVWRSLATSVPAPDVVEIVGFKRVVATVPATRDLELSVVEGTQRLYRWAFQDLSPDRQLAVRQVASLYDADELLVHPAEITASAELVFIGLRTDAVAEVMRASRDARREAHEAVRQTLKNVQDSTKSAGERLLASLVAIGAVVATYSTKALDESVGRNLMLAVAAFLVFLALTSIFLEGPLLSLPLKHLTGDLRASALRVTTVDDLADLPSVAATRKRVAIVRAVVPGTYLALALAVLVFGQPSRFL